MVRILQSTLRGWIPGLGCYLDTRSGWKDWCQLGNGYPLGRSRSRAGGVCAEAVHGGKIGVLGGFTAIQRPDIPDICYATHNRKFAVRDLSRQNWVVGAADSSNSNWPRGIGTEVEVARCQIADCSELNPVWQDEATAVGITVGASQPKFRSQLWAEIVST